MTIGTLAAAARHGPALSTTGLALSLTFSPVTRRWPW